MIFFGSGKLDTLDKKMSQSFQRVREDMDVLFHWVHYLNAQNEQTKRAFEQFTKMVRNEMGLMAEDIKKVKVQELLEHKGPNHDEVKRMVDLHIKALPVETLIARLNKVESAIHYLDRPQSRYVQPKPSVSVEKSPTQLRERLVKKITRHSKAYIKNMLTSYIQKYHKISALKLRDIVVDEQGLCSKSTFYRLLEELEKESNVDVVIEGKQKMFLATNEVRHET